MGKKKHGKPSKSAKHDHYAYGEGWGATYGRHADNTHNGAQAHAYGGAPLDGGLLHGLQGFIGSSRRTEQFLLGALIGAAATYVLTDEKLRGKLIKAGVGLYSTIAGGFEEMKEQVADIQAEIQSDRHNPR